VQTGSEGLVGTEAVALAAFTPDGQQYAGTVRTHGELWKALCAAPVAAGQTVEVQERKGLTLLVSPLDREQLATFPVQSTR
jgi:membrane-bound ClpP family serine protease